jgi:hypothetical protein
MTGESKADNETAVGYFPTSSLAGCANRRRHQGRHQSRGDRFLLAPDLRNGENPNGDVYEDDEEASCWSTRGEHAPVGSGDLPAEAERVLRLRCRADTTSEHARGFDSRSPQPFAAPGQLFLFILVTETKWRQQPESLTNAFPTPRHAVDYILDTFPIVKRKDEAKFNGDYRTKRTILEIFDTLIESMQTGKAYQARLDPPPADARCCHPSRKGLQ